MLAKWIRHARPSSKGMGSPPPQPPPPRTDPFRLLYDTYAPIVLRLAQHLVPGADVPDIVQRVFLALHLAVGRGLDTSRSLRGWLRDVTFRTARDDRELAHHASEVLSAPGSIEAADEAPSSEERMETIDVHVVTNSVLDALRPELRIVLVMSDIEEMTMPEIAALLVIPVGTGYTRLRAARAAFKAAWNERRATGHAAVLPFALWEPHDLLHGARADPRMPAELMDQMWRRVVDALGSGLAGAGVAGAAGAALAATTAKAGAVLTAKQAALGAVVAVLVGVGLHAAVESIGEKPPAPALVVIASHDKAPAAAVAPPVVTATAVPVASIADAPSVAARVDAGAAPSADLSELKWMQNARDALDQGHPDKALDALAHVRSPRFATDREELRHRALAYHDAGP